MKNTKEEQIVNLDIFGYEKIVEKCDILLKENIQSISEPIQDNHALTLGYPKLTVFTMKCYAMSLNELEKAINLLSTMKVRSTIMLDLYQSDGNQYISENSVKALTDDLKKNNIAYLIQRNPLFGTIYLVIKCNEFSNIKKAMNCIAANNLQAEFVG